MLWELLNIYENMCTLSVLDLQLPLQLVLITTNVVSQIMVRRVIKFVSDLWQIGGFLRVLRFPPPIKLTDYIAKILLKVAINTITLTLWLAEI